MGSAKSFLHIYALTFLIGFGCINLTLKAESRPNGFQGYSSDTDKSIDLDELVGPPNGQSGWVVIEPINVLPSDSKNVINIIPYKYRRKKWGQTISLAYSSFYPKGLESNLGALTFDDIYSKNATSPMIEVQLTFKRNLFLGSFAVEIGAGFYANKSNSELVESELEIIPVRLGANFVADAIFDTPYVAPYVGGGGYIFKYKETQGTTSFNGTTQAALYSTIGINVSLDWLEKRASGMAYLDGGIETTSIFLEARKYFASSDEADPNFETDWDGQAGLRLEF